jgi:hypothetical protein
MTSSLSGRRVLALGIVASVGLTVLIWALGWIPASVPKRPDQGPAMY